MVTRDYKDYCDTVGLELSGWRDKVDDLLRKLDHMSTGAKEKVVSEVNGLHILAEELNERIAKLGRECSTNWQPQREDHDVVWPAQNAGTFNELAQSDIGG